MSATNFFHCCANCGSAEDVSAGTTRCPGCGAPITPDEMDINAFTDLQEDLRNAYRAAEKHTQRALLLRVLKWMGVFIEKAIEVRRKRLAADRDRLAIAAGLVATSRQT